MSGTIVTRLSQKPAEMTATALIFALFATDWVCTSTATLMMIAMSSINTANKVAPNATRLMVDLMERVVRNAMKMNAVAKGISYQKTKRYGTHAVPIGWITKLRVHAAVIAWLSTMGVKVDIPTSYPSPIQRGLLHV